MKTSTIAMIGGGALALYYFSQKSANATNPSTSGQGYGTSPYGGNAGAGYGVQGRYASIPNTGSYNRPPSPSQRIPIIAPRRTNPNTYIPGAREHNAGYTPGSLAKLFKGPAIPGARITSGNPVSSGYYAYSPAYYSKMNQQYSTPYVPNQNPYIPPQNYQLTPPTAAPYSQPPSATGYYGPNTPPGASTAYSPPPAPSYSPPPPTSGFYGPNTPSGASTAYSPPLAPAYSPPPAYSAPPPIYSTPPPSTTSASYTPMSYVGGPSSSSGSSGGGYSGGGGGGYSASGGDCWF